MMRFKTRKKHSYKLFGIFLLIFFIGGFVSFYGYFFNPNVLINYINLKHSNTSLVNTFLGFFASSDLEEEMGKMTYVSDPNPSLNKNDAIVYIYNTHQTEEYTLSFQMDYSVIPSVMTASYMLREDLGRLGIPSMVETNDFTKYLNEHGLNYASSYKVSRIFMESAKENNKDLVYFVDLHRDSIPYEASTLKMGDKNYAKVLFVIGKDNPNYILNDSFAKAINKVMEEKVGGISRGIIYKEGPGNNGVYNEDFNQNTILIEIGSSYNQIEEIKNTITVLASAFKEVIGSD